MQDKILSFLKKYKIENSTLNYLVAFSGGFDSMCLLDILKKNTSNRIIAIHLNHNWRGEESDKDEENCRNFCEKIGVEFYSEKLSIDIPHTETAARQARYDFFERCSEKFSSKIIFTAHNKNDNVETVLYRIIKGTGIVGLRGIQPHRDIYYRPLLEIEREEIENYCKNNQLTPNIDSSNTNTKYRRNFIRQDILPKLKFINSNLMDSIDNLSQIAEYLNNLEEKKVL